MTTNTTNAARLGEMSRRASRMYRDMIRRDPAAAGRASWYECMREAAREVKDAEALERVTIADIRAALEDGQSTAAARVLDALHRCAAACPRWAQTRTRTDKATGEKVLAPSTAAAWMGKRESWAESIEHITAEAWVRLPATIGDGDRAPARVLFLATWAACQAIDREYNPNKRSKRSPEERAALELRMIGGRPSDPEAAAIASDILHRAAPSPEDMLIVELSAAGVQQARIAARLGLAQYQISRRLAAIRDRAAAIIAG